MFHTLIRKIRDRGSIPFPASKQLKKFVPTTIPNMQGGLVVPPFDISITHCGYCNRELEWNAERRGSETWEAYDREAEKFKGPYNTWPRFAWGPPGIVFTYGCPMYGKEGWHYHWWSELFMEDREKNIIESGDSLAG